MSVAWDAWILCHFPPLYSSSADPWRCQGGEKEARHGWDHLTDSDGIKVRVAIFRTLGFGAPSLGSVGVPGLKVSEQLSRELDRHRVPLGLPFMGKERRGRECVLFGGVEGLRPPPCFPSSLSDVRGRKGELGTWG